MLRVNSCKTRLTRPTQTVNLDLHQVDCASNGNVNVPRLYDGKESPWTAVILSKPSYLADLNPRLTPAFCTSEPYDLGIYDR